MFYSMHGICLSLPLSPCDCCSGGSAIHKSLLRWIPNGFMSVWKPEEIATHVAIEFMSSGSGSI